MLRFLHQRDRRAKKGKRTESRVYPESVVVFLALAMMAGATVDDLRRRRVDNRWWIPFLGAAIVLDVLAVAHHGWTPILRLFILLSIGVCALFYLLWRFRLFGGADAKGLMVLSLLVPFPPEEPATLFALDVLSNGLLVAVALPVLFAAWNLAHGRFAFPAMFLGFPMGLERAKASMVWPLQRIDDGRVVWMLRRRNIHRPWEALEAHGVERPWITPMVPFMVPLAVGTVLAFTVGNVLLVLMLAVWGP